MTLDPLLQASPAILLHVATVVPAAILGAVLILSRAKGTPGHRLLGKIWLTLMVVTSTTSFFIHELNVFHGFSPIHLLSAFTIAGCIQAYRTARAGNIKAHKRIVLSVYGGGILVAGGFTFVPHRIMNRIFVSGPQPLSTLLVTLAVLAVAALAMSLLLRRLDRRVRA